MKFNNKISVYLLRVCGVLILIFFFYRASSDEFKLYANYKFTTGSVIGYDVDNFRYYYEYNYVVSGIKKTGVADPSDLKPKQVLNKTFVVAYCPEDPRLSLLFFNAEIKQ